MWRIFIFLLTLTLAFTTPAMATFENGKAAYDRQDWGQAILNLRTSGEAGDARALVLLGNMYLEGLGVIEDPAQAFSLYRRAALLGNTDGMFATAVLYQNGDGIMRDAKYAIGWLRRASELGHSSAAFFYAIQLFQGSKGTSFDLKPDPVEAYFWFRMSTRGTDAANPQMPFAETARASIEKLKEKLTAEQIAKQEERIKSWKPASLADYTDIPDEAKQ